MADAVWLVFRNCFVWRSDSDANPVGDAHCFANGKPYYYAQFNSVKINDTDPFVDDVSFCYAISDAKSIFDAEFFADSEQNTNAEPVFFADDDIDYDFKRHAKLIYDAIAVTVTYTDANSNTDADPIKQRHTNEQPDTDTIYGCDAVSDTDAIFDIDLVPDPNAGSDCIANANRINV